MVCGNPSVGEGYTHHPLCFHSPLSCLFCITMMLLPVVHISNGSNFNTFRRLLPRATFHPFSITPSAHNGPLTASFLCIDHSLHQSIFSFWANLYSCICIYRALSTSREECSWRYPCSLCMIVPSSVVFILPLSCHLISSAPLYVLYLRRDHSHGPPFLGFTSSILKAILFCLLHPNWSLNIVRTIFLRSACFICWL